MIHTKIIATIGPASDTKKIIEEMFKEGMRIARLNFSHGSHEYFEKVIKTIREVSPEIAILLDTKGPEIRSGKIKEGEIILEDDSTILLSPQNIEGNLEKISIDYPKLLELKKGDKILIDDGIIETEVIGKEENCLKVKILNGGTLGSNKTVALRGHSADIPFFSQKDREDIEFGIKHNLDYIAASFVRKPNEVSMLRKFLEERNSKIRVIAKIEHWEALKHIQDIIKVSNGIMVARGDLGVEIPLEKVPKIQAEIIRCCNELGKPAIVATQMLESMKKSPLPTRAEIADVAQAILQGADAIMLSGETASGKYPIRAVRTMANIAREYDMDAATTISDTLHSEEELHKNSISMFLTKAAALAANILKTSAIITPTESGFTPRKVSRFRPKCPIYAPTRDMTVFRQLQLSWGVFPIYSDIKFSNRDEMIDFHISLCFQKKLLKKEDKVVLTAGHILSEPGHTNIMEIYKVEKVLLRKNKNNL